MIEDLQDRAGHTAIDADVCLIGAGAAGITLARELASDGKLRVCLVEGGGRSFEEASQDLYEGQSAGAPVALTGGRLRMLGGSTNHWGGRCAPLDPIDLRARDWIARSGWPLTREELEPYYARARRVAGFAGEWLDDAATLERLHAVLPALDRDRARPFVWHFAPVSTDGAYWNWARAYGEILEKAGNLRVLLHANFRGLEAGGDGRRVRALDVASLGGATATIRAGAYVLCCGGIENARLLLLAEERGGTSFGNRHDQVGRCFMQHSRAQTARLVGHDRLSALQRQFNILRGPGGLEAEVGFSLPAEIQERERLLNCSAVLVYEGDPESGITAAQDIWRALLKGHWAQDMGTKVSYIAADVGSLLRAVRERIASGRSLASDADSGVPSRSASIVLDLEQAPDPDSRVTLSEERDALGLRRVRADWRLSELERRTAAVFTTAIAAEFARLGVGRCRLEPWLTDPTIPLSHAVRESFHYIGTTRMSEDPRNGVVDRHCAVHGMANLFLAGSSVFPTGGHANPTLTIVALALRLADRLKSRLATA